MRFCKAFKIEFETKGVCVLDDSNEGQLGKLTFSIKNKINNLISLSTQKMQHKT